MLLVSLFVIATLLCCWYFFLWRAIGAHKQIPRYTGRYPSVTVVRPVKGLDLDALENFRAGLRTGYPGQVETIFVFDSADDPAYPLAAQAVLEFNEQNTDSSASIVFCGAPPKGRTGKLHAMIVAEKMAKGELIAFNDSDTRPDKNVLRVLVETLLTTPKAGASFVPVISDQPITRVGDAFYALLQNGLYAPWALVAAGQERTLPFIMGQYMVISRECLQAIGGVSCAIGQLVDDMYIGKCVYEAGYKNVIAPYSLSIHSSGLSFQEFLPVFRKWFHFGKNGLPVSFLWRQWAFGVLFYITFTGLFLALVLQLWLAMIASLFGLAIFSAGLLFINRSYGGALIGLKYFWTPIALMLCSLGIVIVNRMNNKVQWRGREYALDENASLKEKSSNGQKDDRGKLTV